MTRDKKETYLNRKLKFFYIFSFKSILSFLKKVGILDQQEYDALISSSYSPKIDESSALFLGQNYPNPITRVTTIPFTLPDTYDVSLNLYDLSGRLVKVIVNETLNKGEHKVKVDLQNLSEGTYFYRMEINGRVETLSMMKKRNQS